MEMNMPNIEIQNDEGVEMTNIEIQNVEGDENGLPVANEPTGRRGGRRHRRGQRGGGGGQRGGGGDRETVEAITEHYKPIGPVQECPKSASAIAVSIADKVDSLVGLIAADSILYKIVINDLLTAEKQTVILDRYLSTPKGEQILSTYQRVSNMMSKYQ
uniref:Uncharacterized protein n=1 Tax=Glossina pallidipes TaxID=7398 RepID=A0A1B0ACE4_GLOPL